MAESEAIRDEKRMPAGQRQATHQAAVAWRLANEHIESLLSPRLSQFVEQPLREAPRFRFLVHLAPAETGHYAKAPCKASSSNRRSY